MPAPEVLKQFASASAVSAKLQRTKSVPIGIGSALRHTWASPAGLTTQVPKSVNPLSRRCIRFARTFREEDGLPGQEPAMTEETPCQPSWIHSNGRRSDHLREKSFMLRC